MDSAGIIGYVPDAALVNTSDAERRAAARIVHRRVPAEDRPDVTAMLGLDR